MRVIRLGRAEDNDMVVNHPAVSGYHADIYVYDNGAIQYMDHSTNGTMINGFFVHNSSCALQGTETIVLPGNIGISAQQIISTPAKADTAKVDDQPAYVPEPAPEPEVLEAPVQEGTSHNDPPYQDASNNHPGMFANIFGSDGRIRRLEYNLTSLIYSVIYFILEMVAIGSEYEGGVMAFIIIICIPMYWILFAQGAKRCHDLGHSGWFQIIPFYSVVMVFAEGDHGSNEYGADPKGR